MKRIIKSGCIILFVLTLILLQSRSVRAVAGVAGTVPHAAAFEKEEVVYALLSAEGAAQSAYVVNVFTLLTPGAIVDYGDYKSVQNLTSEDEIFLEGDTIQISTQEKKLYYQGALTEPVALPWLINISYTLDGVPIAPGALAGKSGKLEIRLKIEANPAADQSFFDGCALQTSITLDAARCNNIAAEGATVANAGRNKQIAHTALPGKGLDATISADVENFEMDRISINGVGLAMDFDIDTDEFTGSLTELADAIGELNSGATDIRDATKKLDDGALELLDGAKALGEGALEFDIGMGRLQAGLMEFCGGLKELVDGSREFHYGLTELAAGGRTLMEGSAAIKQGLDTLDQMLSGSGGMGDISQLADSSKA
ncbi:MAG: hypothetical protein LBS18_06440, partial [Clostridiales bacterium]|nr:hypothetical protein [Clostridiales bacterium]